MMTSEEFAKAYGDGAAVAKKAAISVKEMADAWRNIINSMKQLKKELSEDYLNEREE